MYNEYFGFKEAPFSIAPDPRYLYMTPQHRDALAHLVYGINSEGGCILLTGEVGTGKTTICRCLLEQIPEHSNVALVLNPKVSEIELLETICDELKIDYPKSDDPASNNSVKTYTDRIYDFLISTNRNNEKTVLIIDEAQNLDSRVLEQLRLLTNLETNQRKLLQIIILGQPELLDILSRSEMRQLAQRITARFHLQPLTRSEVKAYVSHRLAIAGQNIQLFPEPSIKLLYKLSHGVPRLINIICDRSLLGCYVENQYTVKPSTLKKAAKEVFGELKNVQHKPKTGTTSTTRIAAIVMILTLLLGSVLAIYFLNKNSDTASLQATASVEGASATTPSPPSGNTDEESTISTTKQTGSLAIDMVDDTVATGSNTVKAGADTTGNITTEEPAAAYDDIGEILNTAGSLSEGSKVTAYEQLFAAWGQHYDKNAYNSACNQAKVLSLRCLHKQGNLNNLKTHNRPAVLKLVDDHNEAHYITITSIDGELADIYSDNKPYTVNLSEIDKHWYGQFTLLWKKPATYTSAISPGDRGQVINWLYATLNGSEIKSSAINNYDETLVGEVKKFQAQHGLTADGIVGPLTIIYLNTQADRNIPTLTGNI